MKMFHDRPDELTLTVYDCVIIGTTWAFWFVLGVWVG
jgi:hypothetical protein